MRKKTPKILENKFFYIVVFTISALLIFLPIFFRLNIKDFTSLGLLGVFLFNFISASTLFFPTPGFVATGVGGSLYNPILVAIAASLGSTIGEGVGFAFGYSSKKISNHHHKFLDVLSNILHHKYGYLLIILLAFIPNPFFDVVGIIAGISLYPLRKFLFLVFVGRLARDLIIAWLGSVIPILN